VNASNGSPLWTRILVVIGSIGLLAGALDPLEGSIAIVIGSGLLVLGTFFGQAEPRFLRYRAWVFLLILIGVAAMWVLSSAGGIGGKSGLSMWWGLLLLPYVIGYPLAIVGPGHPRWFLALGIVVGLWYLVLCRMVFAKGAGLAILVGVIGLVTIGGCIFRLATAARQSRTIGIASGE
jgi:hypothetical protein